MDSPAIDFAAMLAKARREARARRGQQQQQQITERQDEQEGQQLRLHQERQGQRQQERQTQHVELQGRTHSEDAGQASQQPTLRHQQQQRQQNELVGVGQPQQQRPPRPMQETTTASDGEGWIDASHAVRRLQAVGVQEVYNELQQHSVGVGKPVLLVDLQRPSDFERKHIRQAVSVHELLRQDALLQRLQQQRPRLLLVYGSSHAGDESFQQLMQHKSAVAATAGKLLSGGGAAVQREPEGADAAAASLLLQQLTKALQERPPSLDADTVQQGHTPQEAQQQQRERQQRLPCLANRSEDLTRAGDKGVTAWLRGGLAAFAAAFPFLCVSSSTENEAAEAPTATNSVAYMSYPLLVHCNFPQLHATADAATAGASVAAAASGPDGATEALQVTDTVVPRPAATLDSATATTTEVCSSAAAAAAEAGPASGPSVVDAVGESVSAVHGLYVGTPLHAASKAVRRRLGIGWIIDLTCSEHPPRPSSSNCCSRLNSSSPNASTLSSRMSGRGRGSASVRRITSFQGVNGEAQDVQVLRPLVSLATKAAVRSFLGCGFDSDDGGEFFPALPHWSESTPERQRELAVAAGRYLLPLGACVELLKHIFLAGRRRSGALEPSAVFVGDDAECVSGCSSVTQGRNTWKSSNSSARSGTADSGISHATSEGTGVEAEWLGEEKDRMVATAKTAFWEMGGSSCHNTTRVASVLIVHCGDSEAWSGSAAAAIVAGFLFAQQKHLQVVLPHQEVRTAMALLSASWRSAPSLEDSHRRQLQRFCEEEKRCIDQPSAEGKNAEVAPGELKRTGCRNQRAAGDLTKLWFSSASRRAVVKSPAAAGLQAMKQSQAAQTRNCRSGAAEEDEEKEDFAGTKTQEAEDAYLRAAAALHTATLCGLPTDAVFILAGDEENRASVCECGTAEGGAVEEEQRDEARTSGASKHEEWPLHLLRHLGRITRHVESVVARASASIEQEREFNFRWTRECLGKGCSIGSSSSDPSTDEGVVGENSAAAAASRSRGQECDKARKKATSEPAAADTHGRDHYKVGDTDAGAAGVPAFPAPPNQETSEEPARRTYHHYEVGAVRLFARLCMDKMGTERGTASTREAIAQPECPRRIDTGTTAALKAKRVTGCHLYKLSTQTPKLCAGDKDGLRHAGDVSSPAASERMDLCEAWELTANTVGSVVRTWSPHLGERITTRVCKALHILLEQLASGCSITLWRALSTQYHSKDVFARVTTAWGVLLLNVCVLWLRMASVVQENVWPSESERKENTCSSGGSSAAAAASHTLLGETLICALLQSTLQLAKCLLLSQQSSASDDAFTVVPEQGFLSRVEGNIERRRETAPSTAASSGGVGAGFGELQTHPSRGELSSQCAEGRETWLFGYPTLGLSMLLWALYGTFLRPQIAPQLQKKLVRAASLVPTVGVPPLSSEPVTSSCTVLTQDKVCRASFASHAAVAEAAAAAAVSSVHHILNSDAVQTALLLADMWAAVHPEDVRKLLQEALQGPGESQGDTDAYRDPRSTCLPTSLGVVLRPLVFASEEYEGQKR